MMIPVLNISLALNMKNIVDDGLQAIFGQEAIQM